MLQNTVLKNPDKPAMLWKNQGTYESLTYDNLWKRIQNFANGLLYLGVKPNDKVAIISNSNFMWGISDFALASIQSVSVPIYPTIPTEQVAYILDNTDIKYAIVENEVAGLAVGARRGCGADPLDRHRAAHPGAGDRGRRYRPRLTARARCVLGRDLRPGSAGTSVSRVT